MGRGIGHVGRAIEAAFKAEPDGAFSVDELCAYAYRIQPTAIEKKHRVAVLRTAKARPDLAHMTSDRPGGMLIFYVPDNVMSYSMARLETDNWLNATDAQLRERLAPGGKDHRWIVPGGAWHRHTEMFKAERDGDTRRLKKLQREQDRSLEGIAERLHGLTPGPNADGSGDILDQAARTYAHALKGLTKPAKARAILRLLVMTGIAPNELEELAAS